MFEIENDFFENLSFKSQHFPESNLDTSFLSNLQTKQEDSVEAMSKQFEIDTPIKSFQKIPKKNRKTNRNKKDDFDYDTYIKQEMSKIDTKNMDTVVKKKLIQKIRNRMSAQRSRMRQKNKLEFLEKENNLLREQLQMQIKANRKLQEENQKLREEVFLKPKRKVLFSTEEESNKSNQNTEQLSREDNKSLNSSILNKSYLFLFAIIAISVLSQGSNTNNNIKMAGLLPFIAKELPMPKNQLAFLEDKCERTLIKMLGGNFSTNIQITKQRYSLGLRNPLKLCSYDVF